MGGGGVVVCFVCWLWLKKLWLGSGLIVEGEPYFIGYVGGDVSGVVVFWFCW